MGAKQSSENPPSEKMNSTKKYKHMAAKKSEKNILWFEEVGANKKDLELVGGKNSSLGWVHERMWEQEAEWNKVE